jgi:ligand-binding sensor domain-containing protein
MQQQITQRTIGITILFLFTVFSNIAQTPVFKHFTTEDGLPSSECYQVLQDKKGFIWIATDHGVSRYNGSRFENFTTRNGLPENSVLRMYEDESGKLWVASLTGKIAYFHQERFIPLKVNAQLSKLMDQGIISSMAYADNTLWIGTYSSRYLYKVQFKNGQQKVLVAHKYLAPHAYLYVFGNGHYIQGCKTEAYAQKNTCDFRFTNKGETTASRDAFNTRVRGSYNVRSTRLNSGNFLFCFNKQLIEIDCKTGKVNNRKQLTDQMLFLYTDVTNGLWIGNYKKGVSYYPKGNLNKPPFHFLTANSVSGIMKDHEGGYWFSTLDKGVFYLRDMRIKHHSQLKNTNVTCITGSEGVIYAGTDNSEILVLKGNSIQTIPLPLANSYVHQITKSKTNDLIIATNSGFGSLSLSDGKFRLIKKQISGSFFLQSKNSTHFWLVNVRVLCELQPIGKNDYRLITYTAPYRINALAEDSKGKLWVGTENGLYYLQDGRFILQRDQNTMLTSKIKHLAWKNEVCWLATKEHGLLIRRKGKVYQINESSGLPSNICLSLLPENATTAWVGTNNGVSKISVASWHPFRIKLKSYSTKNGLTTNAANELYKEKGILYIACSRGITWFKDGTISSNKVKPPIHITGITVNNHRQPLLPSYCFAYDQNNLLIRYIGLSFKNDGQTNYAYRLKGVDDSWKRTTLNKLNFIGLPYGNYVFEVKAMNNDGLWNQHPARLVFEIQPPFWHTWWFRIFTAMALVGTVYWYIRYRINVLEKRASEKERLYKKATEMEMRFLSAQMNPHFTFNAMNSIQHYMLDNEPRKAQQYLAKYSRLIRKVLENSMHEFVSLHAELELLTLYMDMEILRFTEKFEVEIDIDPRLNTTEVYIPPMLIQPYIENAIWHGIFQKKQGNGKIGLFISLEDNHLKCVIEDNGIGRKHSGALQSTTKDHQSFGMTITQERLKQLQSHIHLAIAPVISDITNENGECIGTRVVVHLPLRFIQTDLSDQL